MPRPSTIHSSTIAPIANSTIVGTQGTLTQPLPATTITRVSGLRTTSPIRPANYVSPVKPLTAGVMQVPSNIPISSAVYSSQIKPSTGIVSPAVGTRYSPIRPNVLPVASHSPIKHFAVSPQPVPAVRAQTARLGTTSSLFNRKIGGVQQAQTTGSIDFTSARNISAAVSKPIEKYESTTVNSTEAHRFTFQPTSLNKTEEKVEIVGSNIGRVDSQPPIAATLTSQNFSATGSSGVFDRIRRINDKYKSDYINISGGMAADKYPVSSNYNSSSINNYTSVSASGGYTPLTTNLNTYSTSDYQRDLRVLGSNASY